MLPTTPDQWLAILAKRLDARVPRILKRRTYTNGRAPLPEMGPNLRKTWAEFQRKARTDYGGLAVESLASRICPNGMRIGQTGESEALKAAQRIWLNNRLDVQVDDAKIDYLETGIGYLVAAAGQDGHAVVSRERPEQFIADPDPLRPWKARAALKVYRDVDEGMDYATVWAPGVQQHYFRPSTMQETTLRTATDGVWLPYGPPIVFDGGVPVAILERKAGAGFIEPHEDMIDRINHGKLNRLVIAVMQAFRQRALTGETDNLPETDEAGQPIDWTKEFPASPGALWEIPPGIALWESQPADLSPLLQGEMQDARDFAAVTSTPIAVFVPEGQNQSAEGAASAKEGQVSKANSEIKRLSPGIALAMVYALRIEGFDLGEDTLEMLWVPPDHVSLSEKYAAANQAKGLVSGHTIKRDILGMSPDQIAEDDMDLATEQLSAAALLAQGAPAPA